MTRRDGVGAWLAVLVLAIGLTPAIQAQDMATDATGTWTWSMQGRNGQTRETTLKLKQDGEKLTGTITGFGGETEIKDGMVKDRQVSFNVTRTRNEQTFTTKYSGKLEGDTITGKIEFERNGETQSRDWEAKRQAMAPASQPS